MDRVRFLELVRGLAPEALAAAWDNSGVQVAGLPGQARRVAVCLDPTPAMLKHCLNWGADVVVAHHPLYLKPQAPTSEGHYLEALRLLLAAGAWLYSAHTSLDSRPAGPAFWLGRELGLTNRAILEPENDIPAILVSFTPRAAAVGTDLPGLAGLEGVLRVASGEGEVRLYCRKDAWPAVEQAVRPLADGELCAARLESPSVRTGFGEVGDLPAPMGLDAFFDRIEGLLGLRVFALCGPEPEAVRRVAYCGGSGNSLVERAARMGADVLVTGEVRHHAALEARCLVLDVGHFSLEEEMMRRFAAELAEAAPGVEVRFFPGSDPIRHRVPQR